MPMTIGNLPSMPAGGVVWVVNMDTSASSQYEQYGFNSFFERGGVFYGVADDGIYKLEGATDSGTEILSTIVLGKDTFGTRNKKRLVNMYLGVSATSEMILKTDVDGVVYYYTARNTSSNLKNQRIDLGKGLLGNNWQFTLTNNAGCAFDLESINFTPVITSRGI